MHPISSVMGLVKSLILVYYSLYNGPRHCIPILLIQLCIVLIIHKTDFHQYSRFACPVQNIQITPEFYTPVRKTKFCNFDISAVPPYISLFFSSLCSFHHRRQPGRCIPPHPLFFRLPWNGCMHSYAGKC